MAIYAITYDLAVTQEERGDDYNLLEEELLDAGACRVADSVFFYETSKQNPTDVYVWLKELLGHNTEEHGDTIIVVECDIKTAQGCTTKDGAAEWINKFKEIMA